MTVSSWTLYTFTTLDTVTAYVLLSLTDMYKIKNTPGLARSFSSTFVTVRGALACDTSRNGVTPILNGSGKLYRMMCWPHACEQSLWCIHTCIYTHIRTSIRAHLTSIFKVDQPHRSISPLPLCAVFVEHPLTAIHWSSCMPLICITLSDRNTSPLYAMHLIWWMPIYLCYQLCYATTLLPMWFHPRSSQLI